MANKQYTLYKGDEILAVGTKHEIAKKLNISIKTVHFYGTPSNAERDKGKRRTLIES